MPWYRDRIVAQIAVADDIGESVVVVAIATVSLSIHRQPCAPRRRRHTFGASILVYSTCFCYGVDDAVVLSHSIESTVLNRGCYASDQISICHFILKL
jgi:hypothetical protein